MNILGKDRSQYIRKLIDSNLFTDKEIEKRQQELREESEELEKLKGRSRIEEIKVELNSNWIPYLKNALQAIERDRKFFEGQKQGFYENFGKDLSDEEFEYLLNKVKPKLHEQ